MPANMRQFNRRLPDSKVFKMLKNVRISNPTRKRSFHKEPTSGKTAVVVTEGVDFLADSKMEE